MVVQSGAGDGSSGHPPTTAVGPPDPEVQQLLADLRASGVPPISECTPKEARERVTEMRRAIAPGPEVEATEDLEIPGPAGDVPARRYRPGTAPPAVILYFHGGGWVLGGIDESDALCRALAVASGCEVISVGYRLAPEHPFPAAVEDADAAVRWLGDIVCPPTKIVLLGDSAGGNLAAVTARRARDRGSPPIALQVLIYPVTDHRMDTESYRQHAEGYLLNSGDMVWFWNHYAPRVEERQNPDASPLLAEDLFGLPPALIVIGEYDPLRDEGLAYARRLLDANVEVAIDRYEGMIHGFFPLIGLLSASRQAVDSVGATIAATVGP